MGNEKDRSRNRLRFPPDFMFQLTAAEEQALRSQIATSNAGRGGRRSSMRVFTEHGAIMAANVLNSPRAIRVGILVVRAFVELRGLLSANRALAQKVAELDRRLSGHDRAIEEILAAIKRLMGLPRQEIGFLADLS